MFDNFLKFEDENRLFDLEYRGIRYWQFLRVYVMEHFTMESVPRQVSDKESPKKVIEGKNTAILPQIKILLSNKKYDVLVSTAPYYVSRDNKKVNPFCEFFSNFSLKYKYNFIHIFSDNTEEEDFVSDLIIQIIIAVKTFLLRVKQLIFKCRLSATQTLSQRLCEQFGYKSNQDEFDFKIMCFVMQFNIYKRYYRRILRNKYKCVFMVEHYNIAHFALIQAAREVNIPVIEYQHGVIGRYHFAYNFYNTEEKNLYLPDYLFTFGSYWSESCRLPKICKPIKVGFPLIDESRQQQKMSDKDSKNIVFYGPFSDLMLAIIEDFVKLDCNHRYRIVCKLHPRELKNGRSLYPELYENSNIEIIDTPLFVHELLASSLNHVGISSTVLFEALAFSDRVFVIDDIGSEYMTDFVKDDSMYLVSSAHELLSILDMPFDIMKAEKNATALYEPNSIHNIAMEIEKIIARQPEN